MCQTSPNCLTSPVIEGRTRQAASNTTGAQFQISGASSANKLNPDVGGDPVTSGPTHYCVVWERVVDSDDHDIHYQMVRSDSTLLNGTDQVIDNSTDTLDSVPSVSKSNGQRPVASQQWNVVWQRRHNDTDEDIRGAQIRWDGSISTPSFSVDFSGANDANPQASTLLDGGAGPRDYLVVYTRGFSPDRHVQGTALRGATAVTSSTDITALDGGQLGEDHSSPAVDSDGNRFAVACSESVNGSASNYDVFISTLELAAQAEHLVLTEGHQNLASSSDGEFAPRLTSKQSSTDGVPSQPRRFMAVWWDHDLPGTSDGDIEADFYDTLGGPGAPYCFGDGSGFTCPCDGVSGSGQGCRNSGGTGATLAALGSNDVSAGDLQLRATNARPGQPGLFFQGAAAPNQGNGLHLGDGLRCCGTSVIRLQVAVPDAAGTATSSVNIAGIGGVMVGDTRCYQFWYRDPAGSPCGWSFNLTNGYEVTWTE